MTTLDKASEVTGQLVRTGNIGGILARTTQAGSVFYGYDGGGNVVALTNNAGAEVGSYTYDGWGNTVATSGVAASENPYRFSTKEQIGGLYSYGFRFYSPGLGRWINRDPIGENGGANLYGFVGNDPVNGVDAYGLIGVAAQIGDFTFSTPGYGYLGGDFLFDKGSAQNLGGDIEKGWHPAADGLNPLGDPYYDMGYWKNNCSSNASFALGEVSQQALVQAAGAGALKSTKIMSWWTRAGAGDGGTGLLAEVGKLSLTGTETTGAFSKVAHITNSTARGRAILKMGLWRNVNLKSAFTWGNAAKGKAGRLQSGPSSGARGFIKGAYIAAPVARGFYQGRGQ